MTPTRCQSLTGPVGPEAYDKALRHPQARECDFTGRPLRGMVILTPAGIRSLPRWVSRAATFAASLPSRTTPRPLS
ncbi:MAG: hypothetical protein ACREQY_01440 [Candidatus Binatia bacterium]